MTGLLADVGVFRDVFTRLVSYQTCLIQDVFPVLAVQVLALQCVAADSPKGNLILNVSRPRTPRHLMLNAAAQGSHTLC